MWISVDSRNWFCRRIADCGSLLCSCWLFWIRSGAAEAPWTWLGDVDRWENVRSAIALADIGDDALTYCCLKHELADKLLAHSRFLEALAAYVSILRANKLDRLAMVRGSLVEEKWLKHVNNADATPIRISPAWYRCR
jgi:hypothetical protein